MASDESSWDIFDKCDDSFRSVHIEKKEDESDGGIKNTPPSTTELKCDNCKHTHLICDAAGYCCPKCGVIKTDVDVHMNEKSYKQTNSNTIKLQSRTGQATNPLLPKSSLGSSISSKRRYDNSMRNMCRYHKWNSMPYKERSLWQVFNQIQRKASQGGISSVLIQDAKEIYTNISKVNISRGANRRGLIAACVYMACKRHDVPRSAKEMAHIFDLKVSELTRGTKKLMNIMNTHKIDSIFSIVHASDFVERFCSSLDVTDVHVDIIKKVCERVTKSNVVDSNTPPAIAAGCIFLVSQYLRLNIHKKDISAACKISEVTVGKCYKTLSTMTNAKMLFTDEERAVFQITTLHK